ncbi:MAG: hypothetical protein LC795_09670 [Acidobacteria bacterium]|nr:hypothetical protein [Acidobacteriota bacterium]
MRVRAFDEWNHPAADGSVALAVSAGRLLRVEEVAADGTRNNKTAERAAEAALKQADGSGRGGSMNQAEANSRAGEDESSSEQIVPLVGGEGRAVLVSNNAPGSVDINATTGAVEARRQVRITPEVRPAILVGLGEVTVGAAAPELSGAASDATVRSRLAFFYRGQFIGSKNLLTLAYDSNRPINRTGGNDRLFQFDPLDRAYPLFGDSSTRYEDAQSNSKLYLRLDRGRSYFLFGDFETENRQGGPPRQLVRARRVPRRRFGLRAAVARGSAARLRDGGD